MHENTNDLISGTEEKQVINQLNQNSWSCSQLLCDCAGFTCRYAERTDSMMQTVKLLRSHF